MPNTPPGPTIPGGFPLTHHTAYPDPTYPVNERGRAYAPGLADDERTWALVAHLTVLAHVVLPYVAAAIPLIIWQVKKNESPFVEDHAREALNFHLTLIIYSVGFSIGAVLLGLLTCGVGAVLLIPGTVGVYALGIVGMIMGASAANRGEFFRYPMTLRLVH